MYVQAGESIELYVYIHIRVHTCTVCPGWRKYIIVCIYIHIRVTCTLCSGWRKYTIICILGF